MILIQTSLSGVDFDRIAPARSLAMTTASRLMTYDELRALPDDGQRYELIDGVLVVPAAPSLLHMNAIAHLWAEFLPYLTAHQLLNNFGSAPVDVRFSDRRVLQPDFIYVSPERQHLLANRQYVDGAPDLVIEVLSPSNRTFDLEEKYRIYEQEGVREYWVVDPGAETLTIFLLQDGRFVEQPNVGGIARSVVLPGFEIDVTALFVRLN